MSFALALALSVSFTQLASSISTAKSSEISWQFWTDHAPSPAIRNVRAKRDELNKIRAERSETSSQDEFAKWARLDRKFQQLKKEYDVLSTNVGTNRQRFNRGVRIAKWIATKGVRWYVQWHYRKVPVAWLPHNAVPYYVEYFLAMPSAPMGSISSATWVFAADSTINMGIKLSRRALKK